jgi:flagellar motor switch protein FliN
MSDPDPTDPTAGTGPADPTADPVGGTGPVDPTTDPTAGTGPVDPTADTGPANPTAGAPETVLDEQFGQAAPGTNGSAAGESDLRRLSEVPMELSVEIGRTHITVGETLQLRAGSVITLDRLAGEPADLLVNGTPIARGEVVVVDEQFGLRVTQIGDEDSAGDTSAQTPAQDAPDSDETPEA